MRKFFALAALIFVGVIAWRIGGMLSSDALGMAVGMVFGVMAGIPAALLVLATGRRRTEADEDGSLGEGRERSTDVGLPLPAAGDRRDRSVTATTAGTAAGRTILLPGPARRKLERRRTRAPVQAGGRAGGVGGVKGDEL